MSLLSALQGFNVAFNPFYSNSIVGIGDMDHLEGDRIVLNNPHCAVHGLGKVLMDHPKVKEALNELYGHVLLICTVEHDEVRINVYDTVAQPSMMELNMGYTCLDTAEWPSEGKYYYTAQEQLRGRQRTYKALTTEQIHQELYYDPFGPVQSWTVDLSLEDRQNLGIA